MSNETIIDMEPNSNGVFEAKGISTVKRKKKSQKVARSESPKKTRPGKRKSEHKVEINPVRSVPDPVEQFQEGIQIGLDIMQGAAKFFKVFK